MTGALHGAASGSLVDAGGPLVLVAFALGAFALLLIALLLASRRRLVRDAREIVETLEELRAGRTRRVPDVDPGSPVGVVSDAVVRLERDLRSRWAEAGNAARRWRALTDAARNLAVITTDTDGDVRSFSPGATELFGWDEREVRARPVAVIFEETAYKDLLPKLARRSLRRQGITTRSALLRQDGTSFQAEVTVRMLGAEDEGEKNAPVGFMMIVRDITEQMALENQLRESEGRYRGLVENLSEGVITVHQGKVLYANRAAEQICGRSMARLVGLPWRDAISTRDVLLIDEMLDAVERGETASGELRCTLLAEDGADSAEVRIAVSAVQYGGAPALLMLLKDEAHERRIETELRSNEARLDAVLEATSDGMLVIVDEGGAQTVRMTNDACSRLLGLDVAEMLGLPQDALLERLRRGGEGLAGVAKLIAGPAAARRQASISLDGDNPREIQLTVAPLIGRSGQLYGRVVALRDQTAQRQSERTLQAQADKLQLGKVELEEAYRRLNRVNAQLQSRGEELDRLNGELRRLDEMKTNLLGNVSHELQTPLVSIRGYTEMMLKERLGPVTEQQRRGLTLALKNIDRLIGMIDGLLDFSRADSRVGQLELSRFRFAPLAEEAAELLGKQVAEREIDLRVVVEPDLVVEADRGKMLQVLLNLLTNAVKHTRRGGRIELTARRGDPGFAAVRVRDQGSGIPRDALHRIFERHYQAETGTGHAAEGAGLGLAIVRDILRLHGCTIRAESVEGRGSELIFTVPLGEAHDDRGDDPAVGSAGGGPPQPSMPPDAGDDKAPAAARPRLRIIRRSRGNPAG